MGEDRILLTWDRQLLLRRTIVHAYCPRSNVPDQQLAEVADRYDLAARQAALTRCVCCNGRLAPVPKVEVLDELLERTRGAFDTFARCSDCSQVYWPGAHAQAIARILAHVVPGAARHGLDGRPRQVGVQSGRSR